MSNGDLQPELNELLSAYIDGELTPEERAMVEVRLASDPSAEKMLHELRSVSQSVQRLPLTAVGRDLSDEVLRRIEAREPAPVSAGGKLGTPSESPTKSALFQSRRPWIWASLAVAAGLMIMVMQQGAENGKVQPVFTQSNRAKDPTGVNRELSEPHNGFRLDDESGRQPVPAAAADPANIASNDALPPNMNSVEFGASPAPAAPAVVSPSSGELYAGTPSSVTSSSGLGADRSSIDKSAAKEISALGDRSASTTPARSPSDVATDAEIRAGKLALRDQPSPAPMPAAENAPLAVNTAPSPVQAPDKLGESGALRPEFRGGGGLGQATSSPPAAAAPSSSGFAMGGAKLAFSDPNSGKEGRRPQVVVHLIAKADSFENRSIDKVLASHGVLMNQNPQKRGLVDGKAVEETNGQPTKTSAGVENFGKTTRRAFVNKAPAVDLVLVEAPQTTIASCLAELKDDAKNFVGVEVDEPEAEKSDARKKVSRLSREADKKLETDLRQYNRGSVPQQQKDYYDYFTDFDTDGNVKLEESKLESQSPFGAVADGTKTEDPKNTVDAARGRDAESKLRRFSATAAQEGEKLKAESSPKAGRAGAPNEGGESARRSGVDLQYGRAVTGNKEFGREAETDDVAVLFVISPEVVAAAGPATEKASK